MTPRRTTHLDLKGRGDKSMLVKRETAEDVYAVVLQRLSDRAKTSASSRLRIGVADLGAYWEASDDKEVSHAQEVRCTALG